MLNIILSEDIVRSPQADDISNPVLTLLIVDYRNYHLVLVIFVGCAEVALLSMVISGLYFLLRRHEDGIEWSIGPQRIIILVGISLAALTATLLGVILLANVTNVINPRKGLLLIAHSLQSPTRGPVRIYRYQEFCGWIKSGSAQLPLHIQYLTRRRQAWQAAKAAVCGFLFLSWLALGTILSRRLLRSLPTSNRPSNVLYIASVVSLLIGFSISIALFVMTAANLQNAVAPLVQTLLFG